MKLREFNFNQLRAQRLLPFGMCVRVKGSDKWYEEETIGKTLKALPPEFADYEIAETRWFFDQFVIELKPKEADRNEIQ